MMLVDFFFVMLSGIAFLKHSDFLIKQMSLFVCLFIIYVRLSEYIFGLEFSARQGVHPLDEVHYSVIGFYLIFLFINWRNNALQINLDATRITGSYEILAGILLLPFIIYMCFYLYNNGVRITGAFQDHRGVRNVLTDYMFVYFCVVMVILRSSKLILIAGLFAALAHLLSAERMRTYVYVVAILINYLDIERRNKISVLFLFFGFVFANIIGLLRTGDGLDQNQNFNVSHFGSATVSSLYMLDYQSVLSFYEKVKFSFGMVLGNVIPSILLPIDYDVRRSLFENRPIPGGGWLPVFIYSVSGGYLGVLFLSLSLGYWYRTLRARVIKDSSVQGLYYIAFIIFVSTSARWFMYTPYQIFKMALYGVIIYGTLSFGLKRMNIIRRLGESTERI